MSVILIQKSVSTECEGSIAVEKTASKWYHSNDENVMCGLVKALESSVTVV